MSTFYDFPAEHWVHLRTTNSIESTFATVRHRTRRTKGCGSRSATLTMIFKLATEAEILPNPLYSTDAATYAEYDRFMSEVEAEATLMHETVNRLHDVQGRLEAILKALPAEERFAEVRAEGDSLLAKLKAWDGDMISRATKAYDDVENFPNRFTANYLFLINHAESDLPSVTQPSLDRLAQLNGEWSALKARADQLTAEEIPALNKKLWALGVGAIWKK